MRPIFLFSLPRSGSTLVQHMLAAHESIATASEPWILLPYVYTLKPEGAFAEYSHRGLVAAVEDFCTLLPNGKADYEQEVRELAMRLYAKCNTNGCSYFLDKTPRYHLVVEEVIRLFPDGKFIFLWRNPLSVVSSLISTFAKGKWKLWRARIDLFKGLDNLVQAYQANRDKVCSLRYEDLIADPEKECRRVLEYLELPYDPEMICGFKKLELTGSMGDPTGIKQYSRISGEPLEKWKKVLGNPLRQAWCRRYVRWIGPRRLEVMGYDMADLLAQLDSIPASLKSVGSDSFYFSYNLARKGFYWVQKIIPAFS